MWFVVGTRHFQVPNPSSQSVESTVQECALKGIYYRDTIFRFRMQCVLHILHSKVLLQDILDCNCSIRNGRLHCQTTSVGWYSWVAGWERVGGWIKRKGVGPWSLPGCTRPSCTLLQICGGAGAANPPHIFRYQRLSAAVDRVEYGVLVFISVQRRTEIPPSPSPSSWCSPKCSRAATGEIYLHRAREVHTHPLMRSHFHPISSASASAPASSGTVVTTEPSPIPLQSLVVGCCWLLCSSRIVVAFAVPGVNKTEPEPEPENVTAKKTHTQLVYQT